MSIKWLPGKLKFQMSNIKKTNLPAVDGKFQCLKFHY